jgi:hypothetical protein
MCSHLHNGGTMTANPITPAKNYIDPPQISGAAAAILRGVQRMLRSHDFVSLSEVPLANDRRADVLAIGPKSTIWIVEIKSSIADFRADQKWPEYREYCDALLFAVAPDFPVEILPPDCGLILADAYGGEIMRPPPEHPLATPRRKALILSFAQMSARRLQALIDPGPIGSGPTSSGPINSGPA